VNPPSTAILVPVMNPALKESRNRTAAATSADVPTRPIGCYPARPLRELAFRNSKACAHVCINCLRAYRVHANLMRNQFKRERLGQPERRVLGGDINQIFAISMSPAIDAVLTIKPPPLLAIAGAACLVARITPSTLVSITLR